MTTSKKAERQNPEQPIFVQIRDDVVDQIIEIGLSKTESKLFFYLYKLDRFGDKPAKLKVVEILEATGIGKTAYHAAMSKFETLGWFDFKHTDVEISNRCTPNKKSEKADSRTVIPNTRFGKADKKFGKANFQSEITNEKIEIANSEFEKTENEAPKPALGKASRIPHTLQTLQTSSDLNKTLSESTRERNLILWKNLDEETKNQVRYYAHQVALPKLPTKPTLPEAWINCHCEELFNQMMYDVQFQKQWGERSANSPTVENEQVVDW